MYFAYLLPKSPSSCVLTIWRYDARSSALFPERAASRSAMIWGVYRSDICTRYLVTYHHVVRTEWGPSAGQSRERVVPFLPLYSSLQSRSRHCYRGLFKNVLHSLRSKEREREREEASFSPFIMAFLPLHDTTEMASFVRESFRWHWRSATRPPHPLPDDYRDLCQRFTYLMQREQRSILNFSRWSR